MILHTCFDSKKPVVEKTKIEIHTYFWNLPFSLMAIPSLKDWAGGKLLFWLGRNLNFAFQTSKSALYFSYLPFKDTLWGMFSPLKIKINWLNISGEKNNINFRECCSAGFVIFAVALVTLVAVILLREYIILNSTKKSPRNLPNWYCFRIVLRHFRMYFQMLFTSFLIEQRCQTDYLVWNFFSYPLILIIFCGWHGGGAGGGGVYLFHWRKVWKK